MLNKKFIKVSFAIMKIKAFATFRRTFTYLARHKNIIILDLLFSLVATICEIMCPKLLKSTVEIVSIAIKNSVEFPVKAVINNAFIFIFLATLEIIGIYYMNYVGHIVGAKIETDMRRDLFSHIQRLSIDYFSNTKTGQLLSRFTHDLDKVTEFMHHLPEQMIIAAIKFPVCSIIMVETNIYIGAVVLICSPIIFIVCRHYNIKLRKAFKVNAVQLGELNSYVENSLLGVHITKSFANEKYEEDKFEVENDELYKTKKKLYKNLGQFSSIMRLCILSTYFIIAVVGIYQVVVGNIGKSSFLMCFMYADIFLREVIMLVRVLEKYQEGHVPLVRFFEILDINPKIEDAANLNNIEKLNGKIEFKNVYFKYAIEDRYVLNNLNITINRGEKIALIGPSGAGKTTFCSLIQRFYDATDGLILIDGIDIKSIPLNILHRFVGVVEQNIYVFPGTIFENIKYGNTKASDDEVILAAKDAGLVDFVESLPNKFETHVGERGVRLSGGQKQRISIARMFLKNPSIVIFDEATSSLDVNTEKVIKNSLKKLCKDKTTITISHKLSTIKNMDRIFVLQNGKIVNQGVHDELIKIDEFYNNICKQNYI